MLIRTATVIVQIIVTKLNNNSNIRNGVCSCKYGRLLLSITLSLTLSAKHKNLDVTIVQQLEKRKRKKRRSRRQKRVLHEQEWGKI